MVPPASHRVSRVPWYSGSCQAAPIFAYRAFTLFGRLSQNRSANRYSPFCSPQPRNACIPVWALSLSLAATQKIEVSFFSSGYLDVSVPRVSLSMTILFIIGYLCITIGAFPHSEICGLSDICSCPQLIAACHVLLRLLVPRHPPCALSRLTFAWPA